MPIIIWMAVDIAVPQADDPNPSMLLLNEVHTSDITGTDFIEIYTKLVGQPVSLEHYYIIVAERGSAKADSLQVIQIIDLSKKTLPPNQQYGIITTFNGGTDSLVAPFPNADWKTYVPLMLNDFLNIKENRFLSIYLLYSKDKKLTDLQPTGRDRKLFIKDELLHLLGEKSVDYTVIRKANGPSSCKLVDQTIKNKKQSKVMDILDLFLDEHSRAIDLPYHFSVSRCGTDIPFNLRSFKHSEPTPKAENDCTSK